VNHVGCKGALQVIQIAGIAAFEVSQDQLNVRLWAHAHLTEKNAFSIRFGPIGEQPWAEVTVG
jgi:hypothetical protein